VFHLLFILLSTTSCPYELYLSVGFFTRVVPPLPVTSLAITTFSLRGKRLATPIIGRSLSTRTWSLSIPLEDQDSLQWRKHVLVLPRLARSTSPQRLGAVRVGTAGPLWVRLQFPPCAEPRLLHVLHSLT
jgi:hypothetical protein